MGNGETNQTGHGENAEQDLSAGDAEQAQGEQNGDEDKAPDTAGE